MNESLQTDGKVFIAGSITLPVKPEPIQYRAFERRPNKKLELAFVFDSTLQLTSENVMYRLHIDIPEDPTSIYHRYQIEEVFRFQSRDWIGLILGPIDPDYIFEDIQVHENRPALDGNL